MGYFGNNNSKIFDKRGIIPIITVTLLLVISITTIFMIEGFLQTSQSGMFADLENSNINSIKVLNLKPDDIFIRNSNSQDVNFSDIQINSRFCSINGTILGNSINKFSLNNCLNGMDIGPKTIVVFTDIGIYTKIIALESVTFTQNQQIPSSGSFSGYAWNEQIGFISFNGSGYQVGMDNNELYGHAYSENYGFISFIGSNYGIINVDGILSGYAYGENIGYINFNNSPIYETSFNGTNLNGYAYSENFGYIHFNYPLLYEIIAN